MRSPFEICRAVIHQYDDEFGKGAARVDLILGFFLTIFIACPAIGLLVFLQALIEGQG